MGSYLEDMFGLKTSIPNVKRMLAPDPGYVIVDVDLEQADAQVVAWESGCERLKEIFKDPNKDLHDENTSLIYGYTRAMIDEGVLTAKEFKDYRFKTKGGVHGTNYRGKAPTISKALGISVADAQEFQDVWFAKNPEIPEWHRVTEETILTKGYLENKFGFRRVILERVSVDVLNEAQAWVPQSTVAHVINEGWMRIEESINTGSKDFVQILLQTHDSLTMQIKKEDLSYISDDIRECMLVEIPYEDPLTIGVGEPELSETSYGEIAAMTWSELKKCQEITNHS